MKFKSLLVLVGTIASISLASALPASAEFGKGGKHQELVSALGLTEAQQSQLSELREDMRSQMDNILTSEQKAAMQNARSEGRRPGRGTLNLTEDQREQMRSIRQDFRADLEGILTDEQIQKLDEMRQSRRDRR
ncbi:MAG: Spy/CpxP family protein refolding chaperone [Cyanobacteria bacterium SBLK]|nr:Spy/CpxP family protein refolding chaperone [Cyanobacteria bacterium SBLK]